MERYENLDIAGIDVFGIQEDIDTFLIDMLVDHKRQQCYLFNSVSVTHAIPEYETVLLRDLVPVLLDDSLLQVDANINLNLPPILTHSHPFVGLDIDYVRLVLKCMVEAVTANKLEDLISGVSKRTR